MCSFQMYKHILHKLALPLVTSNNVLVYFKVDKLAYVLKYFPSHLSLLLLD